MSSIPAALLRSALVFVLFIGSAHASEWPLWCFYSPVDSEDGLTQFKHCARRSGNSVELAPEHFKRLDFEGDGLASAHIDGEMYYINRQGKFLHVLTFDNGADYFVEGLVRAWVNGKVGYYDTNLEPVIPAIYDWGTPFDQGRAEVCQGCTRSPADADGHWAMGGGKWGIIDRTGKLVEPLR